LKINYIATPVAHSGQSKKVYTNVSCFPYDHRILHWAITTDLYAINNWGCFNL